jgi:hypothetical protein
MKLILIAGLFGCTTQITNQKPIHEDSGVDTEDTEVEVPVDSDGDGVADEDDACPEDPTQWTDDDGDGHCDEVDDDCDDDPTQWIDTDGDGLCDDDDPCPETTNNGDSDGDGICDEDDDCPLDPTNSNDADGDSFCDESDDCPDDPTGWVDSDGDGDCDDDDDNDGDGVSNAEETQYGEDCAISNPNIADSDEDGISDNEDPYPRDPWPEFILFRNDTGTIDLMLSNRDGTFQTEIEIGDQYGDTGDSLYRYTAFAISDWNNDGKMDFLAVGDSDPSDSTNDVDIWWFWREKADELEQRLLGTHYRNPISAIADFNNDELVDLVGTEVTKPSNITNVLLRSYSNLDLVEYANCFVTEDPTNPDDCAFFVQDAVSLYNWSVNQWIFRNSKSAVDINNDGNMDLAILKISSGGNSANVPISVILGAGDGTFSPPPATPLITHNSQSCGDSPANVILFGDFNGDNLGDIITGLDDDGDAGSAWFYPGLTSNPEYTVDTTSCTESFDINPGDESGSENFGNTSAAYNFDFNFDGIDDILVGYRNQDPWTGPSETVLLIGQGDGTFVNQTTVRSFSTSFGMSFAVPKRICNRFPI